MRVLITFLLVNYVFSFQNLLLKQKHGSALYALEDLSTASFFYSKKDFNAIGLSETMHGVLNYLNLQKPSKIQALAFNEILHGQSCIVADQTGRPEFYFYLL